MTANGGWFYDIYAERVTVNNAIINNATISEDCTVFGTLYARKIVGDITKTFILKGGAKETVIPPQDFDRILVSHPVVVIASNESSSSVAFTVNGAVRLTISVSAAAGATHSAQDSLHVVIPANETVSVGYISGGGGEQSNDYPSRVVINVFKE
nr:DUF3672 domain-containing protein [Serratia ureilytica]